MIVTLATGIGGHSTILTVIAFVALGIAIAAGLGLRQIRLSDRR